MVTVRLHGRLGNQLFQYAFALALSKKYNTFYVIDDSVYSDSVKKYFETISITDNKYVRRILRAYFNSTRLPLVEQTGFEEINEIEKKIANNIYYEGYFQSLEYTNYASLAFCNLFVIKSIYRKEFDTNYENIFANNKILAIHCRVGDYVNWGGDIIGGTNVVLPIAYYENALAAIEDLHEYKIIVVTDDIESAQRMFSFIPQKSVVSGNEIVDFQVLLNADKVIISNSTFAWWAAMLNTKQAQVFAPEYWIGFKIKKEYPHGIMPSQFLAVSF